MILMRYSVQEDLEEDCLTVEDNTGVLVNSFGSEQLVLGNIEDASVIVNRLQFLECYVKELEMHLEYEGWTEKDFKDTREEVELNME